MCVVGSYFESITIVNEDFFLCLYSPIQALTAAMKLSASLQLLDLGQSVGLLGRAISSSQGLYLYTNTEKRPHNSNTNYPCPEWYLNPRSWRPREWRKLIKVRSSNQRNLLTKKLTCNILENTYVLYPVVGMTKFSWNAVDLRWTPDVTYLEMKFSFINIIHLA
jgi:hypothetical protein